MVFEGSLLSSGASAEALFGGWEAEVSGSVLPVEASAKEIKKDDYVNESS